MNRYELAKERYAALGVDTEQPATIPVPHARRRS